MGMSFQLFKTIEMSTIFFLDFYHMMQVIKKLSKLYLLTIIFIIKYVCMYIYKKPRSISKLEKRTKVLYLLYRLILSELFHTSGTMMIVHLQEKEKKMLVILMLQLPNILQKRVHICQKQNQE